MLTHQRLYDNACDFLRKTGNPYGNANERGWGYINPKNDRERCAIASFIEGSTQADIYNNLKIELGVYDIGELNNKFPVISHIMKLFDHYADVCNDQDLLEQALKSIAKLCNVIYTRPKNTKKDIKIKEVLKTDTLEDVLIS